MAAHRTRRWWLIAAGTIPAILVPLLEPSLSRRGGSCTVYQINLETAAIRKQTWVLFIKISEQPFEAPWLKAGSGEWLDAGRTYLTSRYDPTLWDDSLAIGPGRSFYWERRRVDQMGPEYGVNDELLAELRRWTMKRWKSSTYHTVEGNRFYLEQLPALNELASTKRLDAETLRAVIGD
jgi:hypothetical protein